MDFANVEKVIEEIQKMAINTNKMVTTKMEEQAIFYDQKIANLSRLLDNQNNVIQKHEQTIKEQLGVIHEQGFCITELRKIAAALTSELEEVKRKTILSTDNQNKAGRPPLTDDEIALIREGLAKGFSMRKTAEFADVSVGSVHKFKGSTVYGGGEK